MKLADGTFRRTLPDQSVYQFNTDDQLATVTDRNGNVTTYAYNTGGQLITLTDPVGLATTFTYTGNDVTAITDPAGRITTLTYDAAGNLIRITNPDGSTQSDQYNSTHVETASIDALNNKGEDVYDFAGRAASATLKDGSVVQVDPDEVHGLYPASATVNPASAPAAFAVGPPMASYADGNGNVTQTLLDQLGQAVSSSDAPGPLPTVTCNSQNLVTSSTDGRGNETTYTYDSAGDLLLARMPSRSAGMPIRRGSFPVSYFRPVLIR